VPDSQTARPRAALAAAAVAALLWGLSETTSKVALSGLAAIDLLALEIAVATLALWCVPSVRATARPGFRAGYLVLGLCEPAAAYALFNLGLERTSASEAALLVSLEALVLAPVAAVVLRERLTPALVVALVLGVAGGAVLAGQGGHRGVSVLGDALVLAGVVATAAYSVGARRLAPGADAFVVTAYQLLGALVIVLPVWIAVSLRGGSRLGAASGGQWLAAALTGIIGSALPFALYTYAVAHVPATRAAPVLNLVPLVGVGSAVAVLGERLSGLQLLGGLLLLAGLGVSQLPSRHAGPRGEGDRRGRAARAGRGGRSRLRRRRPSAVGRADVEGRRPQVRRSGSACPDR
jgi:drug/metabolite transporter (DMT)-like permease